MRSLRVIAQAGDWEQQPKQSAAPERERGGGAERTLLVHQTKPCTRFSSNVTLVLVSPGRFIKAPSIMST